MAEDAPATAAAPAASLSEAERIGAAIGNAISARMGELIETVQNTGHVPQVPYSKAKFKTPWNPTGDKVRPKLKCVCYQNHIRIDPNKISNRDIELLNILKPGKYLGEIVVVTEQLHNGANSKDICYSNKTAEQRIENSKLFRSFSELLEVCVKESAARLKTSAA
jgi:hypothetical protein